MRKPSGSTQSASHECPKPSTMITPRIASTDITLLDAAQIHSANRTSSSDSGALMIASQVRCTCMRENAEYMPSKEAVNIALWQTMPVPMKAMYFMPPISGMNAPMPYPSASMYSSGSAMLPSTDAIASLRQTSRLRRQTGIQRRESSGGRSRVLAVDMRETESTLRSIARVARA